MTPTQICVPVARTPSDPRSSIFPRPETTLVRHAAARAPGPVLRALGSRSRLVLENLALRKQLAAYRARARRPRIRVADRAFWVVLHQLWDRWSDALKDNHTGKTLTRDQPMVKLT